MYIPSGWRGSNPKIMLFFVIGIVDCYAYSVCTVPKSLSLCPWKPQESHCPSLASPANPEPPEILALAMGPGRPSMSLSAANSSIDVPHPKYSSRLSVVGVRV
jgi:hypothetical protein